MSFISSEQYVPGIDYQAVQPNLDLINSALNTKQAKFEKNYDLISQLKQGYINLDVAADEDKELLNSFNTKMGDWFSNNRNADFSNSRVVDSITGLFDKVSNNPDLMEGVKKTRVFRQAFQEIEDSKKNGKYSSINEQNLVDDFQKYKVSKGKDKLNHSPKSYVPFCDYNKKWYEDTAKLQADVSYKAEGMNNYWKVGIGHVDVTKNLSRDRIYNTLVGSADDCVKSQVREEAIYSYNHDPEFKKTLYERQQKKFKQFRDKTSSNIDQLTSEINRLKSLKNPEFDNQIAELEKNLERSNESLTEWQSKIAMDDEQNSVYKAAFYNRGESDILGDALDIYFHEKSDNFASGVAYKQTLPTYHNNAAFGALLKQQAHDAAGGGTNHSSSSKQTNKEQAAADKAEAAKNGLYVPGGNMASVESKVDREGGVESLATYNDHIEQAAQATTSEHVNFLIQLNKENALDANQKKALENYEIDKNINNLRQATNGIVSKYMTDYNNGKINNSRIEIYVEKLIDLGDFENTLRAKKTKAINNILKQDEFSKYKNESELLQKGNLKHVDDIAKKEEFLNLIGLTVDNSPFITTSNNSDNPFSNGIQIVDKEALNLYIKNNKDKVISAVIKYNKNYEKGDTKKLANYFENPDVASFYKQADEKLKVLAYNKDMYIIPDGKEGDELELNKEARAKAALMGRMPGVQSLPTGSVKIIGVTKDNMIINITVPPVKKESESQEYELKDSEGKTYKIKSGESVKGNNGDPMPFIVPIGSALKGMVDMRFVQGGPISAKIGNLGDKDWIDFSHVRIVTNNVSGEKLKLGVDVSKHNRDLKFHYSINGMDLPEYFRNLPTKNPNYANTWDELTSVANFDLENSNPDYVFDLIKNYLKTKK